MIQRKSKTSLIFLAPATIHLALFAIFPIFYALYLSLFDWKILRDTFTFVGFQNFSDTLTSGPFWNAMYNSFRFTAVGVPLGMIVALGVAILVSQPLRGTAIFRTIFYIPAISSGVAISMLWIYIYLPENGLINMTGSLFGFESVDFLNQTSTAMWALVFMSVWTGLGPKMIIYVAGLLSIPQSLYEASRLDGGSRWTSFTRITLPLLAPTTLFVLVTGTIASFQVFTPIYMMTKGGPLDTTNVIGYHIYTQAWRRFDIGGAAAQSFVLLAFIAAVAFVQFKLMRKQLEGYSAS